MSHFPTIKTILALGLCALATTACQRSNPDSTPPNSDAIPAVDPAPEFENDSIDDSHKRTTDVHTIAARVNPEFAALLRETGIGAELSADDALHTVFVPEPDKFDRSVVTADPDEKRKMMRYYVVPGRMTSSELTNLATVPSASGQSLDIHADASQETFAVNQAWVTQPNMDATNGVVHVIDSMLLPPDHPGATGLRDGSPNGYILVDASILSACDIRQPKAYFGLDSANLRVRAQNSLDKLATCVTQGALAGQKLKLEGHTDPRGTKSYNKELGRDRATAVGEYLTEHGVQKGQLDVVSHGEKYAHDENESFWDSDRRVDIRLASPISR